MYQSLNNISKNVCYMYMYLVCKEELNRLCELAKELLPEIQ